ncbi:N-acetyllactosaminide 3-alpha-galactosyltransferase [Ancylostoma caninum]|uniref:Hexosyltransferase n=1 Tax=Ancylostoma caninum TaxID=29170 RepID=A0A368GHL6_ANCCA|nr:N-acetyllactosaminide 3-alpha-galactosyltransferase [Ancylostoma caninum]
MSDRRIEAVNIRARTMFGNVAFSDPLLQLLNYTIVPDQSICVGKEFVVVVHVRAEDEMWRNKWRETYGDPLLTQKFMYALIFSVGLPKSPKQQEKLKNESRVHGDVLQADYMDTYRNLTLKQLAELRYVVSSCQNVKAVVKLDDDVGWDDSHKTGMEPFKISYSLCRIDDVFITGVLTNASNVTVEHFHGIDVRRKKIASNKDVFFSVHKEHIIYWFLTYNRNVL